MAATKRILNLGIAQQLVFPENGSLVKKCMDGLIEGV